MNPIKIDVEDLIIAMESHTGELEWFLNTENGEFIPYTPSGDLKDEEYAEEIETGSDRIVPVESITSQDGYRIMENFIAGLDDPKIRNALADAISRHRPFRRFKDALFDLPEISERWFAFHRDAMLEYGREWLDSLDIDYELVDPRLSAPEGGRGSE